MRYNERLKIRAAAPDDLAEILRIQAASPESAGWSEAAWRELLAAPGAARAWVATPSDAAGILGFLLVQAADADEAEILDLAVDPPRRRQGVGAALLEALFAAHPGEIFLEVRVSNDSAIALYRGRGFTPVGSRRAYYHSPVEDAIVMRRTLKPAKMQPKRD